ncbi:MAG: hypothetical protein CW716_02910 [Candidatus Bathyarchaeum sp.]|nr:MAG: hypothetical protein CW716_02910 [Candidatus Bathyarchaeum sp.]
MGIASRAFRNLARRKIRAALVVIALSFSMAIMIVIPAGTMANQQAAESLTGNLGETIAQTEAVINKTMTQIDVSLSPTIGGGPISGITIIGDDVNVVSSGTVFGSGSFGGGGSMPMNESYCAEMEKISGVAAVVPILQVVEGHNQTIYPMMSTNGEKQEGQGFNITVPDYIINGLPLNASIINNHDVLPTNITSGRNLLPGETGKVLLSQNSSAYFGKGVGDTVTILNKTFTVVGIFGPSGIEDAQNVYMDLTDAQEITNSTDTITSMKVFAQSSDLVTSIASAITSEHPELIVNTAQDRLDGLNQLKSMYDAQLEIAQETINQTQIQAYVEIIIAVSATSLIVLFVMLYTVRDRTKEIGTLKAIGAGNRTIMGQFLIEGIMLSIIAGVVGIAIGTIGAPFISSVLLPATGTIHGGDGFMMADSSAAVSTVVVTPELMLLGFGTAVLLGAVGSLYPAWRAARTRPAEAMRYE